MDTVLEGIGSAVPGVVLATSSSEVDQASASGHPTVLSMGDDEPELRLESAVASSAAVLWLTTTDTTDVRSQLRLRQRYPPVHPHRVSGGATRLPTRAAPGDRECSPCGCHPAGGSRPPAVAPARPQAGMDRGGPPRLDPLDRETHLWSASQAAQTRLADLLNETGVEEFQIRGGECMIVHRAEGQRERRNSPFASNES